MAKKSRKSKVSADEAAQVEADRLAAHGGVAEAVQQESAPTEEVATKEEPTEVPTELTEEEASELAAEAEVEEDNAKINSVVAPKFKDRYLANARAAGISGKAAKRSNWDWLSQRIAEQCLDAKHKISIECFTAILESNGVNHSKWTNRNKGWEGRFRMTGRVALQKIVANAGFLELPNGQKLEAPTDFVARYKTKE